ADPARQVQVFKVVEDGVPERYRTHPTHHQREQNAKRIYVRSPKDDRSPWLLFGNVAELKKEVTERFYQHGLERRENYVPKPAAEVQQFIEAEHAESTYDPKYQAPYDERLINPGELVTLPAQSWPEDQLAAWFANWPAADLQQRVQTFRE